MGATARTIMNATISNASQLEKALKGLQVSTSNPQSSSDTLTDPYIKQEDKSDNEQNVESYLPTSANAQSSSKSRTSSVQYSTSQLLYNLAGLTTTTNHKLDAMTDSVIRLQGLVETFIVEQKRQTELLGVIARNTSQGYVSPSTPVGPGKVNKVKDYGFNNPIDVAAELIIKICREVDIQARSRGIRYRSSRELSRQLMNKAISVACSSEFRSTKVSSKPVKLPENKHSATLYIASRIGAVNDINPVLTAQAIRELFDDPECRIFMSAVEEIVDRLSIIRIILPYYEADIISAISYPYFDQEGRAICDWSKISSRSETPDESAVMSLQSKDRERLGIMLAKEVPIRAALSAVTKK